MKELLLYIARSLVDHPEQVTVTEVGEAEDQIGRASCRERV